MNKDALLASIIGFTVGLSITGGIIFGPKIFKQIQENVNKSGNATSPQTQQTTPSIQQNVLNNKQQSLFTVEIPKNETITTESPIKISGKAQKQSLVIIGSSEDEKIISVPDNETFEASISLKEGKNDISIANVVNEKFSIERLVVYYTQEK